MRVPTDEEGRPRFSITQLRLYGADDLRLPDAEDLRGCPRLYRKKYEAHDLPPEPRSVPAELGTVLHRALHIMERDGVGPEDALTSSWSPQLPVEQWAEAREILLAYLDRGGPMTRYATFGHELDLSAQLYVDEDFGPVMFRGILDYLGVDLDAPSVLQGVDYKSVSAPPALATVRKDPQLRAYHWLIEQHAGSWGLDHPQVVMHLDALRYRDVEVVYSDEDIEEWKTWAIAVARVILRDEDGLPNLNPGCTWCPAQHDCPAWLGLPGTALVMAQRARGDQDPAASFARLQELREIEKLITAEIKSIQAALEAMALADGRLVLPGYEWTRDTGWATSVDWGRLHALLGSRFYDVLSTSKAALERHLAADPLLLKQALGYLTRVPEGTAVKKTKIREGGSS